MKWLQTPLTWINPIKISFHFMLIHSWIHVRLLLMYRQALLNSVEYCYKQNLLIKNKMRISERCKGNINSDTVIDLRNINIPFLNIVAEKDDLVAPASSKALNDALTESHDKGIIELNSGHVGLMIGKDAHKELWPKVGEWLKKRS
jgi:polyhydroxyalkanoate synthase subunit PhaC